jgi:hypothetical protein
MSKAAVIADLSCVGNERADSSTAGGGERRSGDHSLGPFLLNHSQDECEQNAVIASLPTSMPTRGWLAVSAAIALNSALSSAKSLTVEGQEIDGGLIDIPDAFSDAKGPGWAHR